MADVNAMDLMLWSVPAGCAVVAGTARAAIAWAWLLGAGATIAAAGLAASPAANTSSLGRPSSSAAASGAVWRARSPPSRRP